MSSRNRRSKYGRSRGSNRVDYQQLEARQMLTVDIGLNVTSATFDPSTPFFAPNANGDIGPNHIVQVINSEFSIRTTGGTEISSQTLETFFDDTAGADIQIGQDPMNNPILGTVQDARVVFDHDSSRWFVSAIIADENGDPLIGNQILLAVSRTNNPVDGFQSVQFVGDTTDQHFNSFATLAVDGDGVFITTNNAIDPLNLSVSIYAIPKADLIGTIPSGLNLTRFENLDENVFGNTIQIATDLDGDTNSSYGLGTFENGTIISLVEISNVGSMDPVTMTRIDVTVPFYEAADGGRQPNDVTRLNNISPDFTGNAVSQGGYLWTVQTVNGSNSNSAVRWYQIDEATGTVANTGDIEAPNIDFLYPSIAVNQFGAIAIGFTGTGVQIAPSSFLTLGFSAHGLDDIPTVTFPQAPQIIQMGLDNFVNIQDGINPWGEYSATRVDPDDPFSFFTFQQFVSGDDAWGITIGEGGISNIAPVINANDSNNDVVLRRSALNNAWAEIVIDGVVTDVYEMAALSSIELNLMGGDDTLTIDNSLGPFLTGMGLTVNAGAGMDLITFIDASGHRFDISGDGSGTFDLINTFTGFEIIVGSDGDDIFTAVNSASDWMIFGGSGNDLFDIGNSVSGTYQLAGQAGDDTYRLPLANFALITVDDFVGAENDILVGLGTDGNDVLLVNNDLLIFNAIDVSNFNFPGIEQISFDGLDGNDIFNIQAIEDDTTFFGNDGNDTFNVSSNAPANSGITTGIVGQLSIDGGSGFNRLEVSNQSGVPVSAIVTTDQIVGFTALPINYTGDFGAGDGTQGVVLTGSDFGPNNFEIISLLAGNRLLARGGAADDIFTVRSSSSGEAFLDGGAGADTYRTTFGVNTRNVTVVDSGTDDARDRFSIRATEMDDIFTIVGQQFVANSNSFNWDFNLENLVVDTLGGNDVINVAANATRFIRIILGDGDDSGIVNGSDGIETLRFDGDLGADSFQFLNSVASSFVQALGGDGNDVFLVGANSFARSKVDGQAGDDSVEVQFASRDSRRVNARDTGGGMDQLLITGTPTADRVELRPQVIDREGEIVTYDSNSESLVMNLLGSADILDIFGTSAATFEANLGVGNDTVNVFSTSTPNSSVTFDVSLASGADTANIFRVSPNASVSVFGQTGNDSFNVGSTTLTDDGNLSLIRGSLFIGGGSDNPGIDVLQVNDRGAGPIAFDYTITDTSISHEPGEFNITRPFSSFSYSSMEFVFLSGTDGRNTFNVLPSLTTVIRVDGNLNPLPDMFFGDRLRVLGNATTQGRQLFTNGSNGFFTFADGSQNVSFEEIELIVESPGTMNLLFDPSVFEDIETDHRAFETDPDDFVASTLTTAMDLI